MAATAYRLPQMKRLPRPPQRQFPQKHRRCGGHTIGFRTGFASGFATAWIPAELPTFWGTRLGLPTAVMARISEFSHVGKRGREIRQNERVPVRNSSL